MYLMPWPGPQVTLLTVTLFVPCPNETQSSPVLMTLRESFMVLDLLICIPSVFGLSSGASIVSPWNLTK